MPKAFVKIGKQIMIVEVTEAVMNVLEEGRHKEENFRHEARRHWNGKNFNEERMIAKESYWIKTPEDIYVAKEKIKVLAMFKIFCKRTNCDEQMISGA